MKNEELEKIKQWLPRGYAKIVQAKTGKGVASIYRVLSGYSDNEEITEKLIELAIENKNRINERQLKIAAL